MTAQSRTATRPSARALKKPPAFFDYIRAKLFAGKLGADQVTGMEAILKAAGAAGWSVPWAADALGTAFLETNQTMQPVREAYWLKERDRQAYLFKMYDIDGARPAKARELGNITPGDGVRYGGAGFAQVTGRKNFAEAEKRTGIPFVAHPERMLECGPAAAVMISGMEAGWFTGKALRDYLPSPLGMVQQFEASRRIINGTDRAANLATYALAFQSGLVAGGWA